MRGTRIRRCRQPLAIKGCALTQFLFYLIFFRCSRGLSLLFAFFVYSRMSSALRGERILHVYSSRGNSKDILNPSARTSLSKCPCQFCIIRWAGKCAEYNVKGRATVKFTILWRTLSGKQQTVRGSNRGFMAMTKDSRRQMLHPHCTAASLGLQIQHSLCSSCPCPCQVVNHAAMFCM